MGIGSPEIEHDCTKETQGGFSPRNRMTSSVMTPFTTTNVFRHGGTLKGRVRDVRLHSPAWPM